MLLPNMQAMERALRAVTPENRTAAQHGLLCELEALDRAIDEEMWRKLVDGGLINAECAPLQAFGPGHTDDRAAGASLHAPRVLGVRAPDEGRTLSTRPAEKPPCTFCGLSC